MRTNPLITPDTEINPAFVLDIRFFVSDDKLSNFQIFFKNKKKIETQN